MLENLTKSFTSVLDRFKGTGKLSAADIETGLREVRRALLEADVNFKVARDFSKAVGDQLLEEGKLKGITGSQQVIGIFQQELTRLMQSDVPSLPKNPGHPMVLLLAGLQGAGKTTTASKLALWMRTRQNRRVLLAACDLQRPGAVDQLVTLGKQLGIDVHAEDPTQKEVNPVGVAKRALKKAKDGNYDALIVDSAGRLHIDDSLMEEISAVHKTVKPDATYLVLDSMTGQDAVESAQSFSATLDIHGVILTKIDGDTRGGAALSVRQVTGKPISFLGVGEKSADLEEFDAARLAGRILDMGDVVGLVEKAQEAFDEEQQAVDYERMMKGKFTMQDLLDQFRMVKKMGSMKKLMGMMPGMGKMSGLLESVDDSQFGRMEAIILSMTPAERLHPEILDGKRRRRIARGSGVEVSDVNRLYKSFQQMQKQMKAMKKMMSGGRSKKRMLKQLGSSGKLPNMPGYK
ncbi:MAG: signal recognition particle protein [Planctomycetota bacterium]|jgi:signal recognition particle subunit SRP54|nr:signal recognition particle protein [Planctomycetota bacterium]